MCKYSLSQVPDSILEHDLAAHLRHEGAATALVLAHLAEVDARKLYLPAGYPSMFVYCVEKLGLSEDCARKRIHAARAAIRFPELFEAVADRRLHLCALVLLAPHLSPQNARELISATAGKSKGQVEEILAARFPSTEPLPMTIPLPAVAGMSEQRAPGRVARNASETARSPEPGSRIAPIAAGRVECRLALEQEEYDDLRYAQALLRHVVPSGDPARVVGRALKLLVREVERQKFAATSRRRAPRAHASANPRHIPASVKCAVWERDQGQCTFVADDGHRCAASEFLEYDHIEPVARGGASTIDNLRLRCRAHNQYEAARAFGAGFMDRKREEARAAAPPKPKTPPETNDMISCLRQLGFRAEEARRAATHACEALPDGSIEERLRLVLSNYGKARGWVAQTPAPA